MVLTPPPTTHILRSRFPALSIFAANRNDGAVGPIGTTEPEDALVTRLGLEVSVRRLPPGGATFLTRLVAGNPLAEAAAAAFAEDAGFDLAANIVGMLDAGAFTTIGEPAR